MKLLGVSPRLRVKMLLRFMKDGQTRIQALLPYNSWSEN